MFEDNINSWNTYYGVGNKVYTIPFIVNNLLDRPIMNDILITIMIDVWPRQYLEINFMGPVKSLDEHSIHNNITLYVYMYR